jgi:hypothetical protein
LGDIPHFPWPVYISAFCYHPAKRILIRKNPIYFKTLFGRRKNDNIYSTMLDRTKFMRTDLSPIDNNLPFQLLKRNCSLSSTIFCSFVNLQNWIGIPIYLIENLPWLHPNNSAYP